MGWSNECGGRGWVDEGRRQGGGGGESTLFVAAVSVVVVVVGGGRCRLEVHVAGGYCGCSGSDELWRPALTKALVTLALGQWWMRRGRTGGTGAVGGCCWRGAPGGTLARWEEQTRRGGWSGRTGALRQEQLGERASGSHPAGAAAQGSAGALARAQAGCERAGRQRAASGGRACEAVRAGVWMHGRCAPMHADARHWPVHAKGRCMHACHAAGRQKAAAGSTLWNCGCAWRAACGG